MIQINRTSRSNGLPSNTSIAVIIPCYKVRDHILEVLEQVPNYVEHIFVVDDACPEKSGALVETMNKDPRVTVIFNSKNLGVGGAVIAGYEAALSSTSAQVFVKIDGDGQLNPAEIQKRVALIVDREADYTKGNRFDSLEGLEQMPRIRIFGNAVLSLMSKLSTGYWDVNDPTNGFTAIHTSALERVALAKLQKGFFFESDVLFRLSLVRAVVTDVPMSAIYGAEKSNLKIRSALTLFPRRHFINLHKRIFYNYYLREWNVASLELPAGIIAIAFGIIYGASTWATMGALGIPATSGQTLIAAVPIILGFQLFLSFLNFDVASVPKRVIQK